MKAENINIMLVEDHKLIRVGIRTLFDEAEGYTVIGESSNGKEAIDTVNQEEMNKPHSKHEAPMPEREGASK